MEYVFDAVNVMAQFAPSSSSEDDTYLMLVAHYDSRYSQPMPKDTVWSYGAADDGYGLGVILETVSQVLKSRNDWSQGLKVLFTDAEEAGMMGMKAIAGNDPEVFGNVGLLINLEARGPWGPVLLLRQVRATRSLSDFTGALHHIPLHIPLQVWFTALCLISRISQS